MEAGPGSTLALYVPRVLAMVKERQTNKSIHGGWNARSLHTCEAYCWLIGMKIQPEISLVFFSLCLHLWLRSHLGEVWESRYRPVIILLQINSKSFDPECLHGACGESANTRIAMTPFIYPVLCSWPSINQTNTHCSSKRYVGMTNHSQFLEDTDSKSKETLTS